MAEPALVLTVPATTEEPRFFIITRSIDEEDATKTSSLLPDYLLSASQRLTEIHALPDDWDSYGALRISDRAIEAARQLLLRLPWQPANIGNASPYALAPLASGGIQIEWRGNRTALEIEIDAGGRLSSLLAEDHERGSTYDERDALSAHQAVDLISQMIVA